jgi:uncharacterized membrane protein YuzA (DUF378 family)
MYTYFWLHKIATILVVVGALNWGLIGAFNFNLVNYIFKNFKSIEKLIYILVGIAALSIMFFRDTYLPFLGNAVFPTGILSESSPQKADKQIKIKIKPNTQIIYWAANPSSTSPVKDPWTAYDSYDNAGITTSDHMGNAIIKFQSPSSYKIPSGFTINKHIHYRTVSEPGILSTIKTIFI